MTRRLPVWFAAVLLLGPVIGMLIASEGARVSAVGIVRAALPTTSEAEASVLDLPPHELPREWRWAPKGVEFEHMYRTAAQPSAV